MDIWAWVGDFVDEQRERGNARLAELMLRIPDATCDDRHAEVDALVPEALALARAQRNPWAEVFIRHWHLQSRVLHRHEVADCLHEAVNLLDYANGPAARDCPQSVCVTQDLACCYGDLDGPGYVQERLAVAAETLERIDPSWPCFDCISGEYVSALLDDDRPDEALAFIEGQRTKLAAIGVLELGSNLGRDRADALLLLGRQEEALRALEAWDNHGAGEHAELEERLLKVRVLVALGRHDEACELMPSADEVSNTAALYQRFVRALVDLIGSGRHENDLETGKTLTSLANRLDKNGALFLTAWTLLEAGELAVKRGASEVSRRLLDRAEAVLPRLRRPQKLRAPLARLLSELDSRSLDREPPPSSSAGAVREELTQDTEQNLERLAAARRCFPEDPMLVRLEAVTLAELGFAREAEILLRAGIERQSESAELLAELGALLLEAGRHEDLDALLDSPGAASTDEMRDMALWIRARSLYRRGESREARTALRQLVSHRPAARNARTLLARIERELGDPAGALSLLDGLVAELEPGDADWERMLAATVLGAWDQLRESAARLGMEFEGRGPIDVNMGLCRLEFTDDRGLPVSYFATRTGPVTARVLEIAAPDAAQRFGDLVLFEAKPRNPEAAGDERPVFVFPALATLEPASFRSYAVHGVHPGQASLDELQDKLEELGCELQVRSDDSYELSSSDGHDLVGLYAYLAVPAGIGSSLIHRTLQDATRAWSHPVTWLALAEELGDTEELARQEQAVVDYGL